MASVTHKELAHATAAASREKKDDLQKTDKRSTDSSSSSWFPLATEASNTSSSNTPPPRAAGVCLLMCCCEDAQIDRPLLLLYNATGGRKAQWLTDFGGRIERVSSFEEAERLGTEALVVAATAAAPAAAAGALPLKPLTLAVKRAVPYYCESPAACATREFWEETNKLWGLLEVLPILEALEQRKPQSSNIRVGQKHKSGHQQQERLQQGPPQQEQISTKRCSLDTYTEEDKPLQLHVATPQPHDLQQQQQQQQQEEQDQQQHGGRERAAAGEFDVKTAVPINKRISYFDLQSAINAAVNYISVKSECGPQTTSTSGETSCSVATSSHYGEGDSEGDDSSKACSNSNSATSLRKKRASARKEEKEKTQQRQQAEHLETGVYGKHTSKSGGITSGTIPATSTTPSAHAAIAAPPTARASVGTGEADNSESFTDNTTQQRHTDISHHPPPSSLDTDELCTTIDSSINSSKNIADLLLPKLLPETSPILMCAPALEIYLCYHVWGLLSRMHGLEYDITHEFAYIKNKPTVVPSAKALPVALRMAKTTSSSSVGKILHAATPTAANTTAAGAAATGAATAATLPTANTDVPFSLLTGAGHSLAATVAPSLIGNNSHPVGVAALGGLAAATSSSSSAATAASSSTSAGTSAKPCTAAVDTMAAKGGLPTAAAAGAVPLSTTTTSDAPTVTATSEGGGGAAAAEMSSPSGFCNSFPTERAAMGRTRPKANALEEDRTVQEETSKFGDISSKRGSQQSSSSESDGEGSWYQIEKHVENDIPFAPLFKGRHRAARALTATDPWKKASLVWVEDPLFLVYLSEHLSTLDNKSVVTPSSTALNSVKHLRSSRAGIPHLPNADGHEQEAISEVIPSLAGGIVQRQHSPNSGDINDETFLFYSAKRIEGSWREPDKAEVLSVEKVRSLKGKPLHPGWWGPVVCSLHKAFFVTMGGLRDKM